MVPDSPEVDDLTQHSLKIVVGGAGVIGGHVANSFAREGHDVTVIDIKADQLFDIEPIPHERRVVGNLVATDILRRAGVPGADIFIAASNHHEANALAALKAKKLGARKVVALIEDAAYFDDPVGIYRDWFGIDLVLNTRFLVAAEIGKAIRTRGALAVEAFAEHGVEMIQFPVGSATSFTGRPLRELRLPEHTLVVAISRDSNLTIPHGDDTVLPGDEILVLGRVEKMAEIERMFGRTRGPGRKTVILGGGTVGQALARQLSGVVPNIVVIERDRPRCEVLSRELDRVTVIHADGTDADVLMEEGIGSAEVFAAVTGGDERNIIAARLARDLGAARCIAMVSRSGFGSVCHHIGLEVVRSPDRIVLRELARALIPSGVVGVTPVMGGAAEFVEIAVAPESPVAGKLVSDAGFPTGSVLCALVEGGYFNIPHGCSEIRPGNRAIVFCLNSARPAIDAIFG